MKKLKIIFLITFFLIVACCGLIIYSVGWNNVNWRIKDFVASTFPTKEENENVIAQDSTIQGGITALEKFDKNLDPFPDDQTALYMYYKYPLSKKYKDKNQHQFKNSNLQLATLKPASDNAQSAFNFYLQGRLTDFVERGLRFEVGTCYKNDNHNTYGDITCVTCNVIIISPNKEDAVKTIHSFGSYSYDFYYDPNNYPNWKVTNATMAIPFDIKLYEDWNKSLKQIGFEITDPSILEEE